MTTHDLSSILDECLRMMQAGASIDDCIAPYPQYADELRSLLHTAQALRQTRRPLTPDPAVQTQSRARLLAEAAVQRRTAGEEEPTLGLVTPLRGLLGGLRRLVLVPQALPAVLALILLGGAALAAAAVTGDSPLPVPGLSRSSRGDRIELRGAVTAIDAASRTITVQTGAGERTVLTTAKTKFQDANGMPLAFSDFAVGDAVNISAFSRDGSLIAREVERDRQGAGLATATAPAATPPPPIEADDDNRGPGPNAGPGNIEDDEADADEDNRGPGNAEDDGREDDDDDDDDHRGPGRGDDDEDRSGLSGDGDEDDD